MKGKIPKVTLLGSNSGNNLGDAAIMAAILDKLSIELPGAEFYVPTTKPSFVRKHYGDNYNVQAIDIMPWTGSIRFVGLTTMRCLWKSDVALICDGIIFGKKFFNPLFNFLITLVFVVPIARLFGCKVVCYSCGIGPFPSRASRIAARWVMNGCDLLMMREPESRDIARSLGVTQPIELTGDAAFINSVSDDLRAAEIIKQEGIDALTPIFGVNVTAYFDSWLAQDERLADKSGFIDLLAQSILGAQQDAQERFQVVLFSTHPMDEPTVFELAKRLNCKVIHNSKYQSHDIMAVMRRCQLFMGMRFHSLVLASAVGAPVVGLIYAPKVRGYMKLLRCEDYSLELAKLTMDGLRERISCGWRERAALKGRQDPIVNDLKRGAHRAAQLLHEKYFSDYRAASQNEVSIDAASDQARVATIRQQANS